MGAVIPHLIKSDQKVQSFPTKVKLIIWRGQDLVLLLARAGLAVPPFSFHKKEKSTCVCGWTSVQFHLNVFDLRAVVNYHLEVVVSSLRAEFIHGVLLCQHCPVWRKLRVAWWEAAVSLCGPIAIEAASCSALRWNLVVRVLVAVSECLKPKILSQIH